MEDLLLTLMITKFCLSACQLGFVDPIPSLHVMHVKTCALNFRETI